MSDGTAQSRLAERALEPRYTFAAASVLTRRPQETIRRWSVGHVRPYRAQLTLYEPLIQIDGQTGRGNLPLSFLNLLELRFLASYRSKASLPAIRRALDYAAKELDVERPLLEADFAIRGRELFLKYVREHEPYFVNATREGQMAWPDAEDKAAKRAWPDEATFLFRSLDYGESDRAAFRWWPLGRNRLVVLDTRLNGGHPSTATTAARTDVIARRVRAGWSPDAINEDLALRGDELAAALDLEGLAA